MSEKRPPQVFIYFYVGLVALIWFLVGLIILILFPVLLPMALLALVVGWVLVKFRIYKIPDD